MPDNNDLLKLYNSNINLTLIECLYEQINQVLDLVNQSHVLPKNQFIKQLDDLFNKLFEPIAKEGHLLFEKDRILKSSFVNHGQQLDEFNSYVFLSLDLNYLVNIIDQQFYSEILSYLVRFYKSCFNKLNSSLVSLNNTLSNIINENGRKVKQTVQEWKSGIVNREVIDKREKLKATIVNKLPFGHFTYCCSIENISGILKLGILSHNRIRQLNVIHKDISAKDVNCYRAIPNDYLNKKPAHDFVNMHITPQNGIIFKFIINAGGKKNLICLKINPHVLKQKGGYFSEGNVARMQENQKYAKISNDLDKFEFIDWETINRPNPGVYANLPEFQVRKAEILIEHKVEVYYIDQIVVYNYEVALEIMKYFPNHLGIQIVIDSDFFDKIKPN